MELYGDQVEVVKDQFVILELSDIMPPQKKALEGKAVNLSNKIIVTKEINIGSNEKPKMITVGFSFETTTEVNALDFTKSNEKIYCLVVYRHA